MAGISDINIFQNFVGSSVVYNGSSPEPSGYSFKISMATLIDGDSNYWPTDEIIVQLYNSSTQVYKTVLTTNWSIYNNYIYVQDPSVTLPGDASRYSITVYRADDILQDYAGDAWNSLTPQAIAASLDKNMRAAQRALLLSHMSLKVHPQDTTVYEAFTGRNVPDKLTLPQDVSGRAGKALGWDATGTKIVDIGDSITATVDSENTPLTAVYRDENGNAKISYPTEVLHIANKGYVDKLHVDSIADLRSLEIPDSSSPKCVKVLGYYNPGDVSDIPEFTWKSGATAGTYVDNGGNVIIPTGGDGSSAWLYSSAHLNVKWFGAVGDGVTDDTAAIQAAIATGKLVFLPYSEQGYKTTINFYGILNSRFFGEGPVETTDSGGLGTYRQARDRIFITGEVEDADGDRSKYFANAGWKFTPDTKYAFIGSAVGSTISVPYRWIDLAATSARIFDFTGGSNTLVNTNANRTGAASDATFIYQGGQGDLMARRVEASVYSTKPGATHFLASPNITIDAGDLGSTASGAYLQHSEFNFSDGGQPVAVIQCVRGYIRTNAGNTLYQVWIHDYPQSVGSQPIDAFYQPNGIAKRGIDFAHVDTSSGSQATVILKANHRIYWDGTPTASDPSGASFGTTVGNNYDTHDGTSRIFDIASAGGGWYFQVAGSGVASISGGGQGNFPSVKLGAYTVATLPAVAANIYARTFVTDSSVVASGNFGAIASGGGANKVPVYSDGTNWRIG